MFSIHSCPSITCTVGLYTIESVLRTVPGHLPWDIHWRCSIPSCVVPVCKMKPLPTYWKLYNLDPDQTIRPMDITQNNSTSTGYPVNYTIEYPNGYTRNWVPFAMVIWRREVRAYVSMSDRSNDRRTEKTRNCCNRVRNAHQRAWVSIHTTTTWVALHRFTTLHNLHEFVKCLQQKNFFTHIWNMST